MDGLEEAVILSRRADGDPEARVDRRGHGADDHARAEELVVDLAPRAPEVGEHEPPEALFGGAEGTETSIRFLHQVAERLLPGGLCVFEHGFTQGGRLSEAAAAAGLRDARTIKDMAGLDRLLVARK